MEVTAADLVRASALGGVCSAVVGLPCRGDWMTTLCHEVGSTLSAWVWAGAGPSEPPALMLLISEPSL